MHNPTKSLLLYLQRKIPPLNIILSKTWGLSLKIKLFQALSVVPQQALPINQNHP
jgi:hypothetical protein